MHYKCLYMSFLVEKIVIVSSSDFIQTWGSLNIVGNGVLTYYGYHSYGAFPRCFFSSNAAPSFNMSVASVCMFNLASATDCM